jgi:hypothetical protein
MMPLESSPSNRRREMMTSCHFSILLCMSGAAALMEQIEVQFEHVVLVIAELDKASRLPTDPIQS